MHWALSLPDVNPWWWWGLDKTPIHAGCYTACVSQDMHLVSLDSEMLRLSVLWTHHMLPTGGVIPAEHMTSVTVSVSTI